MSSRSSSEIDRLQLAFESLSLEVRTLRGEVDSLQQRLSLVESRTPGDEFEVLTSVSTPTTPSASEAGYTVGPGRQSIARDIGAWVLRALAGQRRGLSGRERIQQASRYYLVFRDFDSVLHNPPLFFKSWSDCKPWVCRHGQSADSLYLGLPTLEEARIVCSSADTRLPAGLTDGRAGRSQ